MATRITTIIFLFYLTSSVKAQEILDWTEYMKLVQKADSLYQNGHFAESASAYSNAFIFNKQQFSQYDKYNAARAWAKAGNSDSAITHLKEEIKAGFYDLIKLKNEEAFLSLQSKKDWNLLLQEVNANKKAENRRLGSYKNIKPKLEQILTLDQKYRKHYMDTLMKYGSESEKTKNLLVKMRKEDNKNLKYVSKIIDKKGWISYKIIGFEASNALFLVVQHADSTTQEKYLPILQQAVKEKKAFGHDLALLEDRVLLRRGQKQIYGSQIQCDSLGKNCWILPIEDEKNVDKRRAEVGLQPLKDYVKYWNIIYQQKN